MILAAPARNALCPFDSCSDFSRCFVARFRVCRHGGRSSKQQGPSGLRASAAGLSWTGVYIGGQVGYEWGRTTFATVNPVTGVIAGGFPAIDEQGVVGGGHVGYNYQLGGLGLGFGGFLVGIEGDVNGASYTGSELLGVTTLRERTPLMLPSAAGSASPLIVSWFMAPTVSPSARSARV